jgi:hypothetical protein
MPSKTRSAYDVSSTRSLKVPGSPSSALQTTMRCCPGLERRIAAGFPLQAGDETGTAATAQIGALDFVEHRRRPADAGRQTFAPGTHVRGHQAVARRPGMRGTQGIARLQARTQQDVGLADVVFDLKKSAGHSASGTLLRISSAISSMRAAVNPAIARLLTSIAGP